MAQGSQPETSAVPVTQTECEHVPLPELVVVAADVLVGLLPVVVPAPVPVVVGPVSAPPALPVPVEPLAFAPPCEDDDSVER